MIVRETLQFNDGFKRWRLMTEPLEGFEPDLHLNMFTIPDPDGPPHDHPVRLVSEVLFGSYVEERFQLDGSRTLIEHRTGDVFFIEATDIHRIISLPEGPCLTVNKHGPVINQWRLFPELI